MYSSVFEELHEHRLKKKEFIRQILYGTRYYLDIHQYSHTKYFWKTSSYHFVSIKQKSDLADQIVAEHVLFHILNSFESFICEEYKEKGQKFASSAIVNIYFNNKRKLSTGSVMKDKVKTF